MKKIFSLFVFLMLLAGIVWFFVGMKTNATTPMPQVLQSVTEKVIPTQELATAPPVRLIIQKIDVDADVESVGQDEKGNMDVPKKDENVGWYNMGYKPGDNGSAVMAGHFDTRTGAPAVFYNISKLEIGDTIQAVDANDRTLTYTVTGTESYDFDKVPLKEIFATSGKKTKYLITCEGVYSQENRNYSKRLVVYSELKE
jgi:sortase A